MEARGCYAVSDLQLGQREVVLSARELGLNLRPHEQVVSHLVLHSWLLDPQQSTPTQNFLQFLRGFYLREY